jgi:hypothetical protein
VSRGNLLATGTCALLVAVSLPGPASASALGGQNLTNEEIIRKWYAAWEKKDLGTFDILLADNFTFTSAAGDDHISKSAFKAQCWNTQVDFIEHFAPGADHHWRGRCFCEVSLPVSMFSCPKIAAGGQASQLF